MLAVKLFFAYPKRPRFGVRYEPFFCASAIYEYGVRTAVSALLGLISMA